MTHDFGLWKSFLLQEMGKSEPSIGGKPRLPKLPNELKREAESARNKDPIIAQPETQSDDDGVRSKPYFLNCTIYI